MRPKAPRYRRRDLTVGTRHKDEGLRVFARQKIRAARCVDRKNCATGSYEDEYINSRLDD